MNEKLSKQTQLHAKESVIFQKSNLTKMVLLKLIGNAKPIKVIFLFVFISSINTRTHTHSIYN